MKITLPHIHHASQLMTYTPSNTLVCAAATDSHLAAAATAACCCCRLPAVYAGMEELLQVQAADDQREVGSRISRALQSWQPAFNITAAPPGAAGTDEEAAAAEAVCQGVALQRRVQLDSLSSVSSLSSVDEPL